MLQDQFTYHICDMNDVEMFNPTLCCICQFPSPLAPKGEDKAISVVLLITITTYY